MFLTILPKWKSVCFLSCFHLVVLEKPFLYWGILFSCEYSVFYWFFPRSPIYTHIWRSLRHLHPTDCKGMILPSSSANTQYSRFDMPFTCVSFFTHSGKDARYSATSEYGSNGDEWFSVLFFLTPSYSLNLSERDFVPSLGDRMLYPMPSSSYDDRNSVDNYTLS